MKKFLILLISAVLFTALSVKSQMILTSVFDGPLTGGTPKGVEIYVSQDIADLTIFGLGSANNGGGSDGEEFTFAAGSATAGDFIYVASESTEFANWFGFAPTETSGSMIINGDDAVELYMNGSVIDVFGDINVDGNGEAWEYTDSWAYRNNGTGPNGTTFVQSAWTMGGINTLDGETTNAGAANPVPVGTFTGGAIPEPSTYALIFGGLALGFVAWKRRRKV